MSKTLSHDEMFDAFVHGKLGKDEWTHEAHLIACWKTLDTRSPSEALTFLRDAITTHNCGVGTVNTEYSGYHETITRFYITLVSRSPASAVEELLDDPEYGPKAPLAYWSKEVLMSSEARLGWLPPDQSELPWPIVADD